MIMEGITFDTSSLQVVNDKFFTHSAGRHYMDNYQGPEQLKEYLKRL